MEETIKRVYLNYTDITLILELLNAEDNRLNELNGIHVSDRERQVWRLLGKLEGHKEIIEANDSKN